MIPVSALLAGLCVAHLATTCLLVKANQQPIGHSNQHSHLRESVEFQAINSYLTDLQPLSAEPALVRPHLEAAISALDGVGLDNFQQLKQTDDVLGAQFKVLLENNPRVLITILRNLLAASRSCEQESSSFLMLIEQQTFDGQFLNRYVRKLLNNCWLVNLNTLGQRLDRQVGKMNSDLFEILLELANRMTNSNKRGSEKISIGKTQASAKSDTEILQVISESQLRPFAVAINWYFSNKVLVTAQGERAKLKRNDEVEALRKFFQVRLDQPCRQLLDKAAGVMQTLEDYERFSSEPAGLAMKLRRQSDHTLDFQLETYRVCKLVEARGEELWSLLSEMR